MEKCFQEAVRYLGYGKNPVDEATSRLVEKGFLELEKVSALRSVFRIFEMNRIDEEKVAIGTLQISSKSLARNLNHCEKAVLFGATLGTGVDRLIARTSLTDMANAVVLQACAAAMLEEFCDEKQFEIGEELEKEQVIVARFIGCIITVSGNRRNSLLKAMRAVKQYRKLPAHNIRPQFIDFLHSRSGVIRAYRHAVT